MKRRYVIKAAGVRRRYAGAAALATPTLAKSGSTVNPKSLDADYRASEMLAQQVTALKGQL